MDINISSQIVVQTAAQWAVDATVYSAKRILVTSDEYYGGGNTRKIKIADGSTIWNSLNYLLAEVDNIYVAGNITLIGSFITPEGSRVSLTANTDNLVLGGETLVSFDANGNYNLTGIDGGVDGIVKLLYNADSSNTITLKNFTTSTVGNRFDFHPGADFVLNPKQFVFLIYTSNRWRILRESIATSTITGLLSSTDWSTFNSKQAALVSGTNIKTINSTTLLGSGDLAVQAVLVNQTNIKSVDNTTLLGSGNLAIAREIQLACSDETTALTASTDKIKFRMPRAATVTGVRASLSTAQTGGNIFTVDIHESGTSILSTKITIDNGEKTSTTAVTAPVISDSAIADDAEITIDIDQIGDGTAKGLKVTIFYTIP